MASKEKLVVGYLPKTVDFVKNVIVNEYSECPPLTKSDELKWKKSIYFKHGCQSDTCGVVDQIIDAITCKACDFPVPHLELGMN
jgi:hypothetical protein